MAIGTIKNPRLLKVVIYSLYIKIKEYMKTTFAQQEIKGRLALDELYKLVYHSDLYDFKVLHTDPYGMDKYDSLVTRFAKETTEIINTHIYEIKIRDASYGNILLEKKKFNALKNLSKKIINGKFKSNSYYVSVHPDGTYIFDLNKIEKSIEWFEMDHNKCTFDKSKGKVKKTVAYLDKSLGKRFDLYTKEIEKLSTKSIESKILDQKQTKISFGQMLILASASEDNFDNIV